MEVLTISLVWFQTVMPSHLKPLLSKSLCFRQLSLSFSLGLIHYKTVTDLTGKFEYSESLLLWFSLQVFRESLEKAESKEAVKLIYEKEVRMCKQTRKCPPHFVSHVSLYIQMYKWVLVNGQENLRKFSWRGGGNPSREE